ncbi:MAG TPA: transporter [Spongiibacteraceae bacterium]|nr:transporter [Spongiibacteraceae bacterium]
MRISYLLPGLLAAMIAKPTMAYDLFDPKPDADLRELSTDRPDTTESPYTVDAGHYQVEWEAISSGRDKNDGVRTETLTGSINLKAGLSDNIDAQLVLEPRTHVRITTPEGHDTEQGMNDTELRLKINMWGNDGGDTAFAVMPFVRFPTHASAFGDDGKMEGGLILPLAFKLPADWDSAVMLEFDAVRNEDNDGYVLEAVQSITFGHSIYGELSGFFEFVNVIRDERGADNEGYFNAGVMYAIGNNGQLDAGFNAGITDAAEDSRYFIGLSWRF